MTVVFTCKSQEDFDNFKRIMGKSKFHADSISYELRSMYFVCHTQNDADKCQRDIGFLAEIHEIEGLFEMEGQ